MSKHNWRFNIGDFVIPVVHDQYDRATKMVVVGHFTEEFADFTKHLYLCSSFKLGDYVRVTHMETELIAWKEGK